MRILSINRATPKPVQIEGRTVLTGIYKEPVKQAVAVHRLGLEGDDQADKHFHGGVDQAVYCYSARHYQHWQDFLTVSELSHGAFGENLTMSDFDETSLCIGDVLRVGSVELQITKPRIPCFKLAHKLNSKPLIKAFLHSGFSGAYCRVLKEGEVASGQNVEVIIRDPQKVSIKIALILQKLELQQLDQAKDWFSKALAIESLTSELASDYKKRLNALTNENKDSN